MVTIPTDFARYKAIVKKLKDWQDVPLAYLPTLHYVLWNGVQHLIQRGYSAPSQLAAYEGYKMVCKRHGMQVGEIPTREQHMQLSRYIWGRYLQQEKEEIEYFARWQATRDIGINIAMIGGWRFGDI